jgi:deoxyxylulose-5-phosphate synthase
MLMEKSVMNWRQKYCVSMGARGRSAILGGVRYGSPNLSYKSSSKEKGSNRQTFGKTLVDLVEKIPAGERRNKVRAVDTDLASSVGLGQIQERFPECFVQGGIMERNNFSAAAGFGFHSGRTGIVSTSALFWKCAFPS